MNHKTLREDIAYLHNAIDLATNNNDILDVLLGETKIKLVLNRFIKAYKNDPKAMINAQDLKEKLQNLVECSKSEVGLQNATRSFLLSAHHFGVLLGHLAQSSQ